MPRFLIPAMLILTTDDLEGAEDKAAAVACAFNQDADASGTRLFLCEASPVTELADGQLVPHTLEGLTCDTDARALERAAQRPAAEVALAELEPTLVMFEKLRERMGTFGETTTHLDAALRPLMDWITERAMQVAGIRRDSGGKTLVTVAEPIGQRLYNVDFTPDPEDVKGAALLVSLVEQFIDDWKQDHDEASVDDFEAARDTLASLRSTVLLSPALLGIVRAFNSFLHGQPELANGYGLRPLALASTTAEDAVLRSTTRDLTNLAETRRKEVDEEADAVEQANREVVLSEEPAPIELRD